MIRSATMLFVAAALPAQAPSPSPAGTAPAAPPQILVSAPFDGVWVDPHPARDGRHWARGRSYKMSFGADGAAYLPLFRSTAPRHWPLRLALPGRGPVQVTVHETGCVLTAEGFPIDERWDLRNDGAEQSFVLHEAPAEGVLLLGFHGDLPYGGSDARGHRFLVEGWGEVVYGHAFAVGDHGDKTPLRSTFAGGTLRIELPADATYPLVVDPFVTTIGVASNEAFDNRNPDVAFDSVSNTWCVVMEERVSALDTDIKVRRFSASGALLDTDYMETSAEIAVDPAVAAANGGGGASNFCAVWQQRGVDIMARQLTATAPSPGTTIPAYTGTPAVLFGTRPDIGGGTSGAFLIVYVEEGISLLPDVEYRRLFSNTTSATPPLVLATLTGCITPKVADMRGANQHWPIVLTDQTSGCLAGDVTLAAVGLGGNVEATPFSIAGAVTDDDRNADVAWDGSRGLIVWDRDMGSHHDVFGQAFGRTNLGYRVIGSVRNLTSLEPGVSVTADQRKPVVACDGVRFAVSYLEGANRNPVCATFALVNGAIVCHEGHVPIATAPIPHDDHAIAAMGTTGGPTTRYFVVTDERDGLNNYDVQGLFYDGRQSGALFATVATGCQPIGGIEPQIAVSGVSEPGKSFTLQLSSTVGLPFLIAGAPQTPVTVLCSYFGLRRCQQGVQSPFLVTHFGTSLPVVVPPTAGLVGLEFAFQGLDMLATGACPASLFGAAFAVSNTIVATIR